MMICSDFRSLYTRKFDIENLYVWYKYWFCNLMAFLWNIHKKVIVGWEVIGRKIAFPIIGNKIKTCIRVNKACFRKIIKLSKHQSFFFIFTQTNQKLMPVILRSLNNTCAILFHEAKFGDNPNEKFPPLLGLIYNLKIHKCIIFHFYSKLY